MAKMIDLRARQTRGPRSARQAKIVFSAIDTTIQGFSEDQARRIASTAANAVREGIMKQRFRHKKLNDRYRKWKIKEGLDPRILVATGDYLQRIQVLKEVRFRRVTRIRVGVLAGRHYSGLTYDQLGRIQEFGASWEVRGRDGKMKRVRIPPRPHFRRVYNKIAGSAREYVRDGGRLTDLVRTALRRYWE